MKTSDRRRIVVCSGLLFLLLFGAKCRAASLNMNIERATATPRSVVVQTTGAEFVFDLADNRIECFQRIPLKRKVAVISGLDLKSLKIEEKSRTECQFVAEALGAPIRIGLDSLLTLPGEPGSTITITGTYAPAWTGIEKPHFLLPDEQGGVGTYLLGEAACEVSDNWNSGWWVRYKPNKPARVLISVFPPRPFDWKQSHETMLHSFSCRHPYPSDGELEQWSKIGKVLTLHSWIWQGANQNRDFGVEQDGSWTNSLFTPKSEEELRRVARTAHRLGMRVIPYMSPYYQSGGRSPAEFARAVEQVMKRYELDGAYFDGVQPDIEQAYEVTRHVRKVIGDKGILYIHSTTLPLNTIYCPFLDCYANYILRGEHLKIDPRYARWQVSSFNLGNAVGTFCYDKDRVDRRMIDLLFSVNARLPWWVQDGTWSGISYHLSDGELNLMTNEYLPRLQAQRKVAGD